MLHHRREVLRVEANLQLLLVLVLVVVVWVVWVLAVFLCGEMRETKKHRHLPFREEPAGKEVRLKCHDISLALVVECRCDRPSRRERFETRMLVLWTRGDPRLHL